MVAKYESFTFDSQLPWLQARRKCRTGCRITASDVALIMGNEQALKTDKDYNEGKGLSGLAEKKRAEVVVKEPTLNMLLGQYVEPLVIRRFAENHTDLKVITPPQYTLYWNSAEPWMSATPDSLISKKRVGLEVKHTSKWMHEEKNLLQALEFFQWQCRWCMAVMGFHSWHLRWIRKGFPDDTVEDFGFEGEHLFKRDKRIEDEMIELCNRFRLAVDSGEKVRDIEIYAGF